jgi:hypothetical protein
MRTTIDLPDALYREVKATAAARGMKMKDFVSSSLAIVLKNREELFPDDSEVSFAHQQKMSQHFQEMAKGRTQTAPVGKLNRDKLYDRHD